MDVIRTEYVLSTVLVMIKGIERQPHAIFHSEQFSVDRTVKERQGTHRLATYQGRLQQKSCNGWILVSCLHSLVQATSLRRSNHTSRTWWDGFISSYLWHPEEKAGLASTYLLPLLVTPMSHVPLLTRSSKPLTTKSPIVAEFSSLTNP